MKILCLTLLTAFALSLYSCSPESTPTTPPGPSGKDTTLTTDSEFVHSLKSRRTFYIQLDSIPMSGDFTSFWNSYNSSQISFSQQDDTLFFLGGEDHLKGTILIHDRMLINVRYDRDVVWGNDLETHGTSNQHYSLQKIPLRLDTLWKGQISSNLLANCDIGQSEVTYTRSPGSGNFTYSSRGSELDPTKLSPSARVKVEFR